MTFIIYIIVLMDNFVNILRKHKLRPTKQRVSLGSILFGKGDRHITAEILKKESDEENLMVSQATVYNVCLLYTSPSPRDKRQSPMPSSA